MQLAYETDGDPRRPALLLVHGFLSCNAQWVLNREALAARRHLVMAELWGHGASPLPGEEQFSLDAYVAQFEALRERLGVSAWAVVGQSYGAGLALRYALACPDAVSAVVVTNSRSALGKEPLQPPRRAPAAAETERFDVRQLPIHPIHARRFPEHVKAAMVESADRVQRDAVVRGGLLSGDLNCVANLGALKMPLLVTNGRYETSFQPDVENLAQLYPDLEIAHLDGGHSVNVEAAEQWNEAVLRFLERVEAQG